MNLNTAKQGLEIHQYSKLSPYIYTAISETKQTPESFDCKAVLDFIIENQHSTYEEFCHLVSIENREHFRSNTNKADHNALLGQLKTHFNIISGNWLPVDTRISGYDFKVSRGSDIIYSRDFSTEVDLIASTITTNHWAGTGSLIVIIGEHNTGKTALGRVLEATGNNVQMVDASNVESVERTIMSSENTVIIDSLRGNALSQGLIRALRQRTKHNGIVVLLCNTYIEQLTEINNSDILYINQATLSRIPT